MRTFQLFALSLLAALWVPAIAQASPPPLACPLELPKTEQTLRNVPSGFTVMSAVPAEVHTLTGFRVNDGPPSREDATMYDDYALVHEKGQSKETLTWKLAEIHDPYAVCLYRSTSQVLFRSLAGYQQCVVESRGPVNTILKIASAVCR